MKWEIENKVISKLFVQGQNIIEPWGIETADSSAFFSLEDGVGYRYEVLNETYSYSNRKYSGQIITQMKEGQWHLNIDDEITDASTIRRKAVLTTTQDTLLMDFVMRFRFKKEHIAFVKINKNTYFHNNTNIYYQYPVNSITLQGHKFLIEISIVDSKIPEGMLSTMYVRDSGDEWVVHVRMIPTRFDKKVIKLCTRWAGTRPLPQKWSDFLLGFRNIQEALWYRGEKSPYQNRLFRRFLNPSAFALVKIPKDSVLMWDIKAKIL